MMNSSQVTYFTLAHYFNIGHLKYLIFIIIMCSYIVIILSNVFLIMVICMNRSLHEPMYLFLCSLFVNELYGSTALFPFFMVQILSDIHTVPASFCFMQIFSLYFYANVQYYSLAIMSYDRYLAICHPLQYSTRMTSKKVCILITISWLCPLLAIIVMISLTASLKLCGNVIYRLYCDNYSVVKLACYDTSANNIYGLVYTFAVLASLTILNIFSYLKILKVCFSGCKRSRQKAISTCTPHLASLLNFSCGGFLDVLQSRFNMSSVPIGCRMFLSLYFITFQPLFNPLLYGLSLSKIWIICKKIFSHKR